MLSLTDLTLNAIEKTSSSLQEVLEMAQVRQALLKRHPILKVELEHTLHRTGSLYGRNDPIAPGIELARIELRAELTVDFDGKFNLEWSRDFDDEEMNKYLSILTEYHSTCVPGSGSFSSEEIQPVIEEIVRIWPCQFNVDQIIYTELTTHDDDRLCAINIYDLDDLEEALESIRKIYLVG